MDMVFILLPLSLLLAFIGVLGYLWAVRRGQYDDLETPAVRMLFDDEDETDSKRKKLSAGKNPSSE